jgi:hypothetical protein
MAALKPPNWHMNMTLCAHRDCNVHILKIEFEHWTEQLDRATGPGNGLGRAHGHKNPHPQWSKR